MEMVIFYNSVVKFTLKSVLAHLAVILYLYLCFYMHMGINNYSL